ncbi:MAG: hypothetical protein JO301_12270 [Chitinophagaceae bacterium]|nr:hypothetical protein [Chitinophagaceae bacterium]
MHKQLLCLAFLLMMLLACEKKLNGVPDDPSTGTVSPDGQLLAGMVTVSSTDSIVTSFQYDASGRCISENYSTIFEYDATGRVYKMYYASQPGSATYVFYQSATGNKVSYTLHAGIDSTVFEYDSDGRVNKTLFYTVVSQGPRRLTVYHTWSYDSRGNIIKRQEYAPNYNTPLPDNGRVTITYLFDYDSAVNPLFANNAINYELRWLDRISPNNMTRQVNIYPFPTALSDTNWISYKYRTDGKPVSAAIVAGSQANKTFKTSYYYK